MAKGKKSIETKVNNSSDYITGKLSDLSSKINNADVNSVLESIIENIKYSHKTEIQIEAWAVRPLPVTLDFSISDISTKINFDWADELRRYIDLQLFGEYEGSADSSDSITISEAKKALNEWVETNKESTTEAIKIAMTAIKAVIVKLDKSSAFDESVLKKSSSLISSFTAGNYNDWNHAHKLARAVDSDICDIYQSKYKITISNANEVDIVTLGTDGEWKILKKDTTEGTAILIREKALECKIQHDSKAVKTGWINSVVKGYLDKYYESKLKSILEVKEIKLLTVKEAHQFFKTNKSRMCTPEENSYEIGENSPVSKIHFLKDNDMEPSCKWWLMPEKARKYVPLIYTDGGICRFGVDANRSDVFVRPVIVVKYSQK